MQFFYYLTKLFDFILLVEHIPLLLICFSLRRYKFNGYGFMLSGAIVLIGMQVLSLIFFLGFMAHIEERLIIMDYVIFLRLILNVTWIILFTIGFYKLVQCFINKSSDKAIL